MEDKPRQRLLPEPRVYAVTPYHPPELPTISEHVAAAVIAATEKLPTWGKVVIGTAATAAGVTATIAFHWLGVHALVVFAPISGVLVSGFMVFRRGAAQLLRRQQAETDKHAQAEVDKAKVVWAKEQQEYVDKLLATQQEALRAAWTPDVIVEGLRLSLRGAELVNDNTGAHFRCVVEITSHAQLPFELKVEAGHLQLKIAGDRFGYTQPFAMAFVGSETKTRSMTIDARDGYPQKFTDGEAVMATLLLECVVATQDGLSEKTPRQDARIVRA